MKAAGEEREAKISVLTIDCPFCSMPLASAAGGGLLTGRKCNCGAFVVRLSEPSIITPPAGVLAAAYHEIRRRMREEANIVGHDSVVDRMALLAAKHVHLGGRQRVVLYGPSGSGKTTIGAAVARATGCPLLIWDVSTSSEAGWAGVDLNSAFSELYQECDRDVDRMTASVIVLDECDKLALQDTVGTAREHKRGQQKSLLALAGGGVPIRFPEQGDRGSSVAVSADDMLIIAAGVFEGMGSDAGPGDLVRYGFSVEFASRFPMILSLSSLEPVHMIPIYRRAAEEAVIACREFGYDVEVPESVLKYVARAVADGGAEVTPRAGLGWISAAVDAVLLRLLDLAARPGTRYRLQPDDVAIPGEIRQRGQERLRS